jgi:hypothetical protein
MFALGSVIWLPYLHDFYIKGKSKGKVRPITGPEGPEGE